MTEGPVGTLLALAFTSRHIQAHSGTFRHTAVELAAEETRGLLRAWEQLPPGKQS